jgi:multiple sugar transport system substrate-binding protein
VRSRRLTGLVALPLLLAVSLSVAACTGPGTTGPEPSSSPSSSATGPVDLTIAGYGAPAEVTAYQQIVDSWNARHPLQQLTLVSAGDRDEQRTLLTSGEALPDIFLTSRRELGWLLENQAIQPVGELLDERGTNFGDDFQRDAITAFSAQDDLQCMPWGVSPMVIYYNTDLIDFDVMALEGLDAPVDHETWTLEQLQAAAEAAVQQQPGARGLQIDQTLRGLAPFIYSAGGQVFDNDAAPTALSFSSDATMSALEKTLPLLRNPLLTLTDEQLAEAAPEEWFERGELGMIEGFRSLTPELRAVPGLSFDVMPMPTISGRKTIGDITGLCLSATAADAGVGADVLHGFGTPQNVEAVAKAGYLVPANVEAAESPDFLQADRDPAHAAVFNETVRDIINPPLLDDYSALETAIAPEFAKLFATGFLDLAQVTAAIDAAALPVLATLVPSPSP